MKKFSWTLGELGCLIVLILLALMVGLTIGGVWWKLVRWSFS